MGRKSSNLLRTASMWFHSQPTKMKAFLGVAASLLAVIFVRLVFQNRNNLFIAAESIHAIGIMVLIYKLTKERTCSGLSLKSQELTAIFLAVRLYCSLVMEYDIHTFLDTATLVTTCWVIYTMRYKLKSTYFSSMDNFSIFKVVTPCAVLASLIHPSTRNWFVDRVLWAFSVYLESISVLPQLRIMQNTKVVEPFTAHYVFALGVSRFLSCIHWIFLVLDTRGRLLIGLGNGLWSAMVLVSEGVQTFILADFCYYYVKSVVDGQLVMCLPTGIV